MRQLEVDAGRRFFDIGLDEIASAEPPSPDEFVVAVEAGRCWIAQDPEGKIGGYASAEVVDGAGHFHQVSVRHELQGQGLGRRLVEHVALWATNQGFTTLTLTTFADVSWNGPLYRHLGFAEFRPPPGSELQGIRDAEIAAGLDHRPRIAMSLDLHHLRPGNSDA